MSLPIDPPAGPHGEDLDRLRRCWGWLVAVGAGVMVAGFGAISYSFFATLTTVLVLGLLLISAGTAQIITSFLVRRWQGFFVAALVGVLHILVGAVMVEHPLRAAAVLTLVIAFMLLAGGAARLLFAATHRFPGRGWTVAGGVISLLLGVSVWREWPEASLWVIGTFAGIELAFTGWGWVMLGLAVKTAGPSARPAQQ